MAKKEKDSGVMQSPMGMDDDWRVHDATRTALEYHRVASDKPLFRKVRKNLTRAARMVSGRKSGR